MEKTYLSYLKKYWPLAQLLLILICIGIYSVDVFWGDGDGILSKFGLNPLSIFIYGQLVLCLIRGLMSKLDYVSNASLSLSVFLIAFGALNMSLGILPIFEHTKTPVTTVLSKAYPFLSYDSVYFKNFRPNTSFTRTQLPMDGEQGVRIDINAHGTRGVFPDKKKIGEHRLLLIGDSFIEGLQVRDKNRIGPQLEPLLADSIKVFQHGYSSWSPLLEFNWLLKKGMAYEPDEVILFLYHNDFFTGTSIGGDPVYTKHAIFDEKNRPISFSFPKQERSMLQHSIHSFKSIKLIKMLDLMWRLKQADDLLPTDKFEEKLNCSATDFEQQFVEIKKQDQSLINYYWDLVAFYRDTTIWDQNTQAAIDLSLGYIRSMHDFLAQKDVTLKVCLIPLAQQFSNEGEQSRLTSHLNGQLIENKGLNQKLTAFCAAEQIEFLDFYKYFKTHKEKHPDARLYFDRDTHWNKQGQGVAAQAIAERWYQ